MTPIKTPNYKDGCPAANEMVQPPESYRSRNPFEVVRATDQPLDGDNERIFRFLNKLGAWQCHDCQELMLSTDPAFFIWCAKCWVREDWGKENDICFFDEVPTEIIFNLYRRLLWDGSLGLRLGPAGNPGRRDEPPEFAQMRALQIRIGVARLKAAVYVHANEQGLHRLWLDALNLVWAPAHGLIPLVLTSGDSQKPPVSDRKAWAELNEKYLYQLP